MYQCHASGGKTVAYGQMSCVGTSTGGEVQSVPLLFYGVMIYIFCENFLHSSDLQLHTPLLCLSESDLTKFEVVQ